MLNDIFNTVKNGEEFTKHIIDWGISNLSSHKDLVDMANVNIDDFVQKLIDAGGTYSYDDISFIKNTLRTQNSKANAILKNVDNMVNFTGDNLRTSTVHNNLRFSTAVGEDAGMLSGKFKSLSQEQVEALIQNTANQVYTDLGFNGIPMRINLNYGTGTHDGTLGMSYASGKIEINFDDILNSSMLVPLRNQKDVAQNIVDAVSHEMRHQYQRHFDNVNYVKDNKNYHTGDDGIIDYIKYKRQYIEKDARNYASKNAKENMSQHYNDMLDQFPLTDSQKYGDGYLGQMRKKIDEIKGRRKKVESNETPPTQEPPQPPTQQSPSRQRRKGNHPKQQPQQQQPEPEPPQQQPKQRRKGNHPKQQPEPPQQQPPDSGQQGGPQRRKGNQPRQSPNPRRAPQPKQQPQPTPQPQQQPQPQPQQPPVKQQPKQQSKQQRKQSKNQTPTQKTRQQPKPRPTQQPQQGPQKQQRKGSPQQQQQQPSPPPQQQTQQQQTPPPNQQQQQPYGPPPPPPKNYVTVDDSSVIEKMFDGDGYSGNIKNGYVQDITINSETFNIKTNAGDGSIDIFDSTGNLIMDTDLEKQINEKVFDETSKFYKGLTDEEWDTVINNAENFRFNANQASESLLERDAKMLNMNDAINTRQKILEEEREAIKKTAENTKGKKNKKKLSDQRNQVDIKWNEAERIKQINKHKLDSNSRRTAARDKFNKTLGLDAYEAGSDEFKQALDALKGTDEYNAAMKVFKKDLKDINTIKRAGIKETNRVIDAKIKGLTGKGLTLSNAITIGSAALGAVNKYKESRAEGKGMVSSAARAGATAIAAEVMGPATAVAVMGARALGNAAVEAGDMLYKESRRMNSMSNFTPLGGVNFQDSQELATMRQSGMELAKMSQYNLEQTLMGAEAKHLHR